MPTRIVWLRIATAVLLAALALAIAGAGSRQSIIGAFPPIAEGPWVWVTLLDLYCGLLVVCAWIAVLERRVRVVVPWVVAVLLLGNLATLAWLLRRALRAESVAEAFLPMPRRSGGT